MKWKHTLRKVGGNCGLGDLTEICDRYKRWTETRFVFRLVPIFIKYNDHKYFICIFIGFISFATYLFVKNTCLLYHSLFRAFRLSRFCSCRRVDMYRRKQTNTADTTLTEPYSNYDTVSKKKESTYITHFFHGNTIESSMVIKKCVNVPY